MNIIVTKDNVKIAEQSLVHKGEYNVNPLVFSFSQEYDGLSKMAVFSTLVKTYETAITNGSCIIPYEVLKDKGTLKIGVYGYTIENDVVIKRYSPTPITIPINDGSYIPNASNPEQQNPTTFEEFMQQLEANLDEKQDVIDENNKIFSDFVNDINQNNKFVKTLTPPVIVKNLNSGIYYVPRGPIAYSNGTYLTSGDTILITTKDNYTNDVYFYHLYEARYEGQWLGAINVGVARANGTGTYSTINPAILLTKNNLTTTVTQSDSKIPTAKAVYDFVINNVPTKVSQLQNDSLYTTEQQVEDMISALGSVFVLKGSVDTMAELPMQDNKLGDVYYVKSESAGYVWIEDDGVERWEELGLTIDTSDFLTKSELAQTTGVATDNAMSQAGVTNALNTKQNIIDNNNKLSADLVGDATTTNKFVTEAEKQAWNNKSDFSGNYNDLTNKPDLTIYEEKTDAEEKYETLLSQIPTATATGETINVQDSSNLPPKDFAMLGNATQGADPTPDSPQDIHVVTGDNTLVITGKNLFTGYTTGKTLNNTTGVEADSNTAGVSDYIPVNFTDNPNYYLSGLTNTLHSNIWAYNKNKQGLGRTGNQARTEIKLTTSSFTSGTPQGTGEIAYIRLTQRYDTGDTGSVSDISTLKTQLEVGSTATDYEPYSSQTQLLSLGNIELAKIGDYTDRIFKSSGKWYEYHEMGKEVFNGSENWIQNSTATGYRCFLQADINLKAPEEAGTIAEILSNRFVGVSMNNTWRSTTGISLSKATESTPYARMVICYESNNTDTLEKFKAWLASNNVTVHYPLLVPTTTEITDTTLIAQLENILAMHTNKNVTNAWIEPTGTNAQAGLTLTYYRDLQTLTDKIDSLEARVSLLE